MAKTSWPPLSSPTRRAPPTSTGRRGARRPRTRAAGAGGVRRGEGRLRRGGAAYNSRAGEAGFEQGGAVPVDLGGSGLPEVLLVEGAAREDGDGLDTGALR